MRALLVSALFVSVSHAAGLGLLTANGSVKLNGLRVWWNGTVFENMSVITEVVGATITLNSGAEVLLAPSSGVRITGESVTLEAGSVMLRNPGALTLKAKTLTRDSSGALLSGPQAARIPALLRSFSEKRPLSQRP